MIHPYRMLITQKRVNAISGLFSSPREERAQERGIRRERTPYLLRELELRVASHQSANPKEKWQGLPHSTKLARRSRRSNLPRGSGKRQPSGAFCQDSVTITPAFALSRY